MAKILLTVLFIFANLSVLGASARDISVTIDGETYVCSQGGNSGSSVCNCKSEGSYTYLYLNGKSVANWYGTGGSEMVACVKHMNQQSYCETKVVKCGCGTEGSYTYLYLNGKSVANWYGTGGSEMVACVNYLNQQSYCK